MRLLGENEGVVVAADGDLVAAATDNFASGEIERGAGDGQQFSRGHHVGIGFEVTLRVQREPMVEHGAAAGADEVEVSVVGQVDGRGPVCRGYVFDHEGVVVGQNIGHVRAEIAREALVAVWA